MALSNRDRVERVMDALRDGLGPFVVREYKMVYKGRGYLDAIDQALTTGVHDLPQGALKGEATLLAHIDIHGWLHLMWRQWNEVFQDKLGHAGRSYVSELIGARNAWAHQQAFSNDEAYRIADTAARLLKEIGAVDEAAVVEEIGRELLRLRYEAEQKKARKTTGPLQEEVTTQPGLKPWREVVQPHPDVASGRYLQAEFVADFSQVLAGTAETEYQNPLEFFRRTFLTRGLLDMLVTGIRRLTAQGGDPVVQLQTAFGGGKTHSMLAMYHLVGGKVALADFQGGELIAEEISAVDLPEACRAVLVGTALNPSVAREYPDAVVCTLWGELAYQIGGAEGYQMVAEADAAGVNPGSDTLFTLLDRFGPCLIIIDELVAYARNLYGVEEHLPVGTFDAVMSFVQSLTEAVRRSSDSMLLVSLPASDIEMGGPAGHETLDRLAHVLGRIEAIWKPVSAIESFEIVRRRLFMPDIDYAARDAVLSEFGSMYRSNVGEFPADVGESDYLGRMRAAYPIHPELFERLYEDWSTLERFQRTRGVLRLMAAVIHQLWASGDQSLLIMPGAAPLDARPVREELLRHLPETWSAVVDSDVDGEESLPYAIDAQVPNLGRYAACRRVARAVFIGSAPSVAAQRVRGLPEIRIHLACAQPGESLAVFGDALRRMSSQLMYLYTDGSRYWYDTHPTVNRVAQDRAQSFSEDEVNREIIERLKKVGRTRDFAAFHVVPADTSDVVDDARVRVVVLHPDDAHKRQNGDSGAIHRAWEILESRGNAQRLYKNMLVFIAADESDAEALRNAAREFLAWQSILGDEERLNLDAQQRRQVRDSVGRSDDTLKLRLMEAYSWLIVPAQPDPMGRIELQASRIGGDDNYYERAARKLSKEGFLIYEWSPDNLRMELDRWPLWGEDGWVGVKHLWEYFAQYCYLPRLADHEVLLGAIQDGIGRLDAPFAYATGVNEEGYHTGLVYRSVGSVYFDDRGLLVHPDAIAAPPAKEPIPTVIHQDPGDSGEDADGPPIARPISRYYGRAQVDAQRVNKDMSLIVEEVIERLTSLVGCDVGITVEINAHRAEGFDEATVRTISENSNTLKFEQYGFEEE